jgi:hypothetical protein
MNMRTNQPTAIRHPALASPQWRMLWAALLVLSAAAVFLATSAQAQAVATAPSAPAPPMQASPAAPAAPRYAAQDIDRVFGFIDANRDGKISRAEAAGFRNIAKHFDAADTNHDDLLSREEFENALNGGKPQ